MSESNSRKIICPPGFLDDNFPGESGKREININDIKEMELLILASEKRLLELIQKQSAEDASSEAEDSDMIDDDLVDEAAVSQEATSEVATVDGKAVSSSNEAAASKPAASDVSAAATNVSGANPATSADAGGAVKPASDSAVPKSPEFVNSAPTAVACALFGSTSETIAKARAAASIFAPVSSDSPPAIPGVSSKPAAPTTIPSSSTAISESKPTAASETKPTVAKKLGPLPNVSEKNPAASSLPPAPTVTRARPVFGSSGFAEKSKTSAFQKPTSAKASGPSSNVPKKTPATSSLPGPTSKIPCAHTGSGVSKPDQSVAVIEPVFAVSHEPPPASKIPRLDLAAFKKTGAPPRLYKPAPVDPKKPVPASKIPRPDPATSNNRASPKPDAASDDRGSRSSSPEERCPPGVVPRHERNFLRLSRSPEPYEEEGADNPDTASSDDRDSRPSSPEEKCPPAVVPCHKRDYPRLSQSPEPYEEEGADYHYRPHPDAPKRVKHEVHYGEPARRQPAQTRPPPTQNRPQPAQSRPPRAQIRPQPAQSRPPPTGPSRGPHGAYIPTQRPRNAVSNARPAPPHPIQSRPPAGRSHNAGKGLLQAANEPQHAVKRPDLRDSLGVPISTTLLSTHYDHERERLRVAISPDTYAENVILSKEAEFLRMKIEDFRSLRSMHTTEAERQQLAMERWARRVEEIRREMQSLDEEDIRMLRANISRPSVYVYCPITEAMHAPQWYTLDTARQEAFAKVRASTARHHFHFCEGLDAYHEIGEVEEEIIDFERKSGGGQTKFHYGEPARPQRAQSRPPRAQTRPQPAQSRPPPTKTRPPPAQTSQQPAESRQQPAQTRPPPTGPSRGPHGAYIPTQHPRNAVSRPAPPRPIQSLPPPAGRSHNAGKGLLQAANEPQHVVKRPDLCDSLGVPISTLFLWTHYYHEMERLRVAIPADTYAENVFLSKEKEILRMKIEDYQTLRDMHTTEAERQQLAMERCARRVEDLQRDKDEDMARNSGSGNLRVSLSFSGLKMEVGNSPQPYGYENVLTDAREEEEHYRNKLEFHRRERTKAIEGAWDAKDKLIEYEKKYGGNQVAGIKRGRADDSEESSAKRRS